jgi:hypothetical protein
MTCRVSSGSLARLGAVAAALTVLLQSGTALAQQTQKPAQMNMADHRGGIQGTVRNESNTPVEGAAVIAVNAENGAQFTATTNAQGGYSFGALPPGQN